MPQHSKGVDEECFVSDVELSRKSRLPLPDECWLRVVAYLEAAELTGSAAALCAGSLGLSNQEQLWVSLLYADFCASLAQRATLRHWLKLHHHYHPRVLYVYKRREHALDLDMARAELLQRGEQAREQDRKQRRLLLLNFVLVRLTHVLLTACLLASSVLLWLRLDEVIDWNYYIIFAPVFFFEVFLVCSASVVFSMYFLRASSGWTFYWNRLRGSLRWLILYTSPCESALVLASGSSVAPLLVAVLEGVELLPRTVPCFTLPFGALWLAALCMLWSLVRRRSLSASCLGSFSLLWLPGVSLSVLVFLKLSVVPWLPAWVVLLPGLGVTGLLMIFVGFLVGASFWLGYRGSRDWTEYATITLTAWLTMLLPLLCFQLAILGYFSGLVTTNSVFLPWVVWLSGLFICAVWHALFSPIAGVGSAGAPIDRLMVAPWRQQSDLDAQSDTELLLPRSGIV